VDDATWMLNPDVLHSHPVISQTGVVVPVSPFGKPVPQGAWTRFQECTGIPVIVDAAAAFSTTQTRPVGFIGAIPCVFSFHATKGFGIGEGGCVVSTDGDCISRIKRALNFGFCGSRESSAPSSNGKLSEYHAAVGLAQLDCWPNTRENWNRVSSCYRALFNECGRPKSFFGLPEVDASYSLFLCNDSNEAKTVQESLRRDNIETRFWYGRGIHSHLHFASAPHDDLSVTNRLGDCLIGLPMALDLNHSQIRRIVDVVTAALAQVQRSRQAFA
jgi:dTDP-4-amino-4,6-dideoxygalactose transaminase